MHDVEEGHEGVRQVVFEDALRVEDGGGHGVEEGPHRVANLRLVKSKLSQAVEAIFSRLLSEILNSQENWLL